MDHVPIAGRVVSGKMVREDQLWYPPRATREALANAICHREYLIPVLPWPCTTITWKLRTLETFISGLLWRS